MIKEFTVDITNEIYRNTDGTFFIYGAFDSFTEKQVSLKSNFKLMEDVENIKIEGFEGEYNGRPTITVEKIKFDLNDRQTQLNIIKNTSGVGEIKAENFVNMLEENNISIDKFADMEIEDVPKIQGFGPRTKNLLLGLIKEEIKNVKNSDKFSMLNAKLSGLLNKNKIRMLSETIKSYEEFIQKPYHFLDLASVSFNQSDLICTERLNVKLDNSERLEFLVKYELKRNLKSGNCYIDFETFKSYLSKHNFLCNQNISKLIIDNKNLIVEKNNVYPIEIYEAEREIPVLLENFIISNKESDINEADILEYIEIFESENGFKLDESQKDAVINCVKFPISIMTGGAGCGKTTTLNLIKEIIRKTTSLKFDFTAPTGKAARRMYESTGEHSKTIHSFLYQNLECRGCFIIDEMSMVDIVLFHQVLKSLVQSKCKKIILIGDPNQLSSIGPGNLLSDLINCNKIKVSKLTRTHRQDKNSPILDLAHAALNKKNTTFSNFDNELLCKQTIDNNSQFDSNRAISFVLKCYERLKEKNSKLTIDEFFDNTQLIAPMKNGSLGVNRLNEIIKNKYNPKIHQYYETKDNYGNVLIHKSFGLGDKVMRIKNNNKIGVTNGDVGRITEIENHGFKVFFANIENERGNLGKSIFFEREEKQYFQLAYACTVHKLQGSEYDNCILVVANDNSEFLDNRLLYTAITRAKKRLIIISEKKIINNIFNRSLVNKRLSNLLHKLKLMEVDNI